LRPLVRLHARCVVHAASGWVVPSGDSFRLESVIFGYAMELPPAMPLFRCSLPLRYSARLTLCTLPCGARRRHRVARRLAAALRAASRRVALHAAFTRTRSHLTYAPPAFYAHTHHYCTAPYCWFIPVAAYFWRLRRAAPARARACGHMRRIHLCRGSLPLIVNLGSRTVGLVAGISLTPLLPPLPYGIGFWHSFSAVPTDIYGWMRRLSFALVVPTLRVLLWTLLAGFGLSW